MDEFRYLRWCATLYEVLAWLGVAVAVITLFTVDISSSSAVYTPYENKPAVHGIGASGVLTILVAAALQFILFQGFSQIAKLLLQMREQLTSVARGTSSVGISVGELIAQHKKTAEHVRLVGQIVYDDAKREHEPA
ncbi:MAG: hypothetical protein U0271_33310 [Polyangiaceae bacterium]